MKASLSLLTALSSAALAVLALAAAILPSPAHAATVPVTVTIDNVRNVSAGDAWSRPPDFYARIWVDGAAIRTPTVLDSNGFTSPAGWTFTRRVSRAARGVVPVRIELRDWDAPFDDPLVDIDMASCRTSDPFGCTEVRAGPQSSDSFGVDVNLNLFDGSWTAQDRAGDSNLGPATAGQPQTACTIGAGSNVASICFTITIGPPSPETLRVSKTSDSDRGLCLPGDCSLREAISRAESEDVILIPAAGTPYLLDDFGTIHLAIRRPPHLPPPTGPGDHVVHLRGPTDGGTAVIRQSRGHFRVFDVHAGVKLIMSRVTVTGGGASDSSTAFPTHVHGAGIHNHGNIELHHVTITGNRATYSNLDSIGGGGGIYNAGQASAKLTNVTIAGNSSAPNGNNIPLGGGIAGPGLYTLRNTIIASNTVDPSGAPSNCGIYPAMHIVDDGGNLQFPGVECGQWVTVGAGMFARTVWRPVFPGTVTDPLQPFNAQQGIYHPDPGGPAVDRGVSGCGPTDQAGRRAPGGVAGASLALCDAGAVESQ